MTKSNGKTKLQGVYVRLEPAAREAVEAYRKTRGMGFAEGLRQLLDERLVLEEGSILCVRPGDKLRAAVEGHARDEGVSPEEALCRLAWRGLRRPQSDAEEAALREARQRMRAHAEGQDILGQLQALTAQVRFMTRFEQQIAVSLKSSNLLLAHWAANGDPKAEDAILKEVEDEARKVLAAFEGERPPSKKPPVH